MSKSAQAALTPDQWDQLLDGQPHVVDLFELVYAGGISGFRSAVYREAEKRYGYAKTKRLTVNLVEVQGVDCRPDFARRHQASPVPWMALDPAPQDQPPTPIPQDQEEAFEALSPQEEEELLGPCTCGQAPQCLPDCARAGGADA